MISIEDRSIPFEELKQEIRRSRFVLVPYAAESILSSGILMDSLSFGAKVIGPAVGSFRVYATEPCLTYILSIRSMIYRNSLTRQTKQQI